MLSLRLGILYFMSFILGFGFIYSLEHNDHFLSILMAILDIMVVFLIFIL